MSRSVPGTSRAVDGKVLLDKALLPGLSRHKKSRQSDGFFMAQALCSVQLDRALNARVVMSSTLPMPLMARYLGAASGAALAQLE